MSTTNAWVLTEDLVGLRNQAIGVAEAMGLPGDPKKLIPRAPWRYMTARLWPNPLAIQHASADPLGPPWPDVLITCGGKASAVSKAIKAASGGRTFTVHIQAPPFPSAAFDFIIAPAHDGLTGPNVFVTRAAVHRVTASVLDQARSTWSDHVAALPTPRVAVLIGGNNGRYRLDRQAMEQLADQLASLARDQGVGLMVTPSRRTGADNEKILRDRLAGLTVEVWDGQGENPFFGYLAWADAFIVTCDSVSMLSEASATGKPIHVVRLDGASRRIDAFNRTLLDTGVARPFTGKIEDWCYDPVDDTAAAAEAALEHFERHRQAIGA